MSLSSCFKPVVVKKDLPEGAAVKVASTKKAKPDVFIVWDGDDKGASAKSWASCNLQGKCVSEVMALDGAGRNDSMGLKWRCQGKDWKGFGWNWYGWWPPDAGDDITKYKNLVFWMRVEIKDKSKTPSFSDLSVWLSCSANGQKDTDPVSIGAYGENLGDGKWHEIVIPISDFLKGPKAAEFDPKTTWEIRFGHWSMNEVEFVMYIDDIGFDNREVISYVSLPEPRKPLPLGDDIINVVAQVKTTDPGTEISPFIYGGNFTDPEAAKEMGMTIRRFGGNATTTYDWRTGFHNKGSDWYFENHNSGPAPHPEKNAWVTFHEENKKYGMESYLTLPCAGWVAKDDKSGAFPLDRYPDQTGSAPDRPNCGNGIFKEGKEPKDFDPTIAFKKVTPEEQTELYRYCLTKAGFPPSSQGGVKVIVLDNEPMLWITTHKAFGYKGLTYNEILNHTITHASLLKKIDPTVQIAAPALWGWTAYYYCSADSKLGPSLNWDNTKFPDYSKHGIFLKWWMTEIAKYEKKIGYRLVDILDIHFYPQTAALWKPNSEQQDNPEVMESRVQNTRVLWDPEYEDPTTWMERYDGKGKKLAIIRMMKEWIQECNPGMKFALGEYNWYGNFDISGGVAQAELLGIFAREGVYAAFLWTGPDKNTPQYFAWKMFRNPDGKFTAFGNYYLPSVVSHPEDVSVHAARADDGRITFVLVNKRAKKGVKLTIKLDKEIPSQTIPVYEYSKVNLRCIGRLPDLKVGGNSISLEIPPMSVMRFDVRS